MRPLRFARELLCLNNKLKRKACAIKPAFDIFSDHPIDTSGGPRTSAVNRDDLATPDLHRLRDVLRAAEREHTIAGGKKHHPIWATELWWESDPPEPNTFASLREQALYLEEALYLLWKQGAKVVINLPLIDPTDLGGLQSGVSLRERQAEAELHGLAVSVRHRAALKERGVRLGQGASCRQAADRKQAARWLATGSVANGSSPARSSATGCGSTARPSCEPALAASAASCGRSAVRDEPLEYTSQPVTPT